MLWYSQDMLLAAIHSHFSVFYREMAVFLIGQQERYAVQDLLINIPVCRDRIASNTSYACYCYLKYVVCYSRSVEV